MRYCFALFFLRTFAGEMKQIVQTILIILGIRQQLPKKGLTFSALLTDVFNTRRWDSSSDNPVYTLVNNSKNRSRIFWLGINWNFHSYKPVGGAKKQGEDRSVIRIGE